MPNQKHLLPAAITIAIVSIFFIGCHSKTDRSMNLLTDTLKLKPGVFGYTFKISTQPFYIEKLIPAYASDTSFHAIAGLTVDTGPQKTYYYSVYRMAKKDVIRMFNSLPREVVTITNGHKEYAELEPMDSSYFFSTIYEEDENNTNALFFYRFRRAGNYETYSYFTPRYMHVLFFDTSANTVYHRVRDVIF